MPTGNFTANGAISEVYVSKRTAFKAGLAGTFVATVQLEMLDSSGNWRPLAIDNYGGRSIYTAPTGTFVVNETENDRQYRWRVTAFTSGTIEWLLA